MPFHLYSAFPGSFCLPAYQPYSKGHHFLPVVPGKFLGLSLVHPALAMGLQVHSPGEGQDGAQRLAKPGSLCAGVPGLRGKVSPQTGRMCAGLPKTAHHGFTERGANRWLSWGQSSAAALASCSRVQSLALPPTPQNEKADYQIVLSVPYR